MNFLKAIILFFLLVLFSFSLVGQQRYPVVLDLKEGCNYIAGVNNMEELYGFQPSPDAQAIVNKLLLLLGIPSDSYQVLSGTVNNAMATHQDGINYIVYSEKFMSQFREGADGEYAVYSILAHEVGHLILNHKLGASDPAARRSLELLADGYSGTALRNLCATREQALAAIRSFANMPQDPLYPPIQAREQMIANSWQLRDEAIRRGELVDPCGKTIPLEFGKKFKKHNLIRNAEGRIMGDQMEITYDLLPAPGENQYETVLVTPRFDGLTPKSLIWRTDPTQPGKGKKAIWYFKQDGYTERQAAQSEGLGVAGFRAKKVPRVRPASNYLPGAGLLAAGGLSFLRAGNLRQESNEMYDLYASERNPAASLYQGNNLGRDEVYDTANTKHRRAQTFRGVGVLATGVGIAWLLETYLKDRRGRIANLHFGEDGIGLRRTIGN